MRAVESNVVTSLTEYASEASEAALIVAAEVLRSDVQSRQWRQQLGPCLTQTGVSVLLGISPQAVAKRAASGSLLRLTNADRRPAYPVGQFQGNRVLDGIPTVLEVLSAVDDELTIASWLTVPKPGLDGRTPLASLHDGDVDQVIEAAHDYAARSA